MSLELSPFLLKALMEFDTDIEGAGRFTLLARDTVPSLLPVCTIYLPPPLYNMHSQT